MTANEFVIEVGNKISGRAIPVRTPNMLKAAEVLSPASLSFKGIKIASILVKRFKTTRQPIHSVRENGIAVPVLQCPKKYGRCRFSHPTYQVHAFPVSFSRIF